MERNSCNDRVVGAILGKLAIRYFRDFPGDAQGLRAATWLDCARCSARQKFHRGLDVALVVLTSLSVFFSVFALAVLKHIKPLEHVAFNVLGLDTFDMYHMLVSAAIAGVLASRSLRLRWC